MVSLLRTSLLFAVLATACAGARGATEPTKLHVGLSAAFVLSGGGALWTTDHTGSRVVRVDPAAGRVQKRISVGGYPFGLAYGAGSIWAGSRYTAQVMRLNARTNRRQKRIRVGGRPNGIAFAFAKVWVADFGRGRLLRVDPRRNRVERRISIPTADWITASPDSLWVSSETGRIYRIDPATMAVKATITVGANPLASAWIDGVLWVPNIDSATVSVVDPATSAVRRTLSVGQSPIAVAGAAGAAWVSSEIDGDLWRFETS